MSDRASIEINCDRMTVSASFDDQFSLAEIGGAMRTTRSSLIVQALAPMLRELMALPTEELKARALAAMRATPT
jgi:hypothetical protein